MALAPGEARKDLSADAIFRALRCRFGSLPDPRSGEVEIPLADALMSAFAVFSLKDPSLLAFDHRRHNPNDNFRTIYGINRVPSDSQVRAVLDPVDPADLRAPFREIFRRLRRSSSATVLSLVPGSLAQDEDQVPPLGRAPSPFLLAALWLNGGVADRSDTRHRTAEPDLWRYVVVGRRCLKTVALLCFGRR